MRSLQILKFQVGFLSNIHSRGVCYRSSRPFTRNFGNTATMAGVHKTWAKDENGNRSFNFASCTSKDTEVIFGAERPGCGEAFDKLGAIPPEEVKTWADFMKKQGVKRVLSLLTDEEYAFFGGEGYKDELVKNNGFDEEKVTLVNVYAPGAATETLKAIKDAKEGNEKLVVHCSGGEGRTGLVLAQYLCQIEGMTAEDAVNNVLDTASEKKVVRRTKPEKLEKFIKNGTLAS